MLASFLLAINFENAEYSTWLSNPMMGLIPILLFFLSIWIIFYQEQHKDRFKWMIVMGFSLGIIEQSAFYSIYFFGPVIIGLIYLSKKLNLSLNKIFTLKEIFAFLIPYFFTIFSMILNQFLLFRAGIFTLKGFESAIGRSNIFSEPKMILEIVNTYLIKYISTVTPSNYLFGIFFALLIIYILFFKKSLKKTSIFLLSWLTAPLWLFIFHFRSSPHMLIGIEYMILISFSFVLIIFLNNKNIFLKTFSISLFFLYVIFQISALVKIREKDSSIFTFQTGVMLHNEIKLIDKTYQIANGRPFSISIWGSPYEYYITWAYLYDWYGKEKYGYVPSYFGTSQIGKYGEKILEQKNSPENLHFLIEEPKIYMVGNIYESFMNKQNSFSKVIYDEKSTNNGIEFFGKYSLQTRENIE